MFNIAQEVSFFRMWFLVYIIYYVAFPVKNHWIAFSKTKNF